jgi:hypothetical protein
MNQELQKTDFKSYKIALNEQNPLLGDWIKNDTDYAIAQTYSEKKLGNYKREDLTLIVELMAQWKVHLGVVGDSFDNELIFITQFLYDNFKHFTISDIRLAMSWAISGKIDMQFVSAKTISSHYVSKALNLYEEEKRRIVNQIAQAKDSYTRHKELNSQIETTPIEKANTFKDHILAVYQTYQSKGWLVDIGDMIYDWIRKNNIMPITKVDVDNAIRYSQDKYIEERANALKTQFKTVLDEKSVEFRKKKLAREYIIMKYFEKVNEIEVVKAITENQFK